MRALVYKCDCKNRNTVPCGHGRLGDVWQTEVSGTATAAICEVLEMRAV
jgi:hypothetical protein